MTENEKKALALLRECGFGAAHIRREWSVRYEALCRAIEAHEAFRQEVSDAVLRVRAEWDPVRWPGSFAANHLDCFIIPTPVHPLVQAAADINLFWNTDIGNQLEAALAARGLEIREIEK